MTTRIGTCAAAMLLCMVPSWIFPDPVPPVEPKAPKENVIREGEKAAEKAPGQERKVFEYNAVISLAGGNRFRASILLPANAIAAAYSQGGRPRLLREEIAKVKSVEFRGWQAVGDGTGRLFCHSAAAITLEDGSVFVCAPVEMLKKFEVRRGNAKSIAHSCWYGSASRDRKKGGGKKKKGSSAPGIDRTAVPHPDAVTGIVFTHDERKSGVEDLLPMIFK